MTERMLEIPTPRERTDSGFDTDGGLSRISSGFDTDSSQSRPASSASQVQASQVQASQEQASEPEVIVNFWGAEFLKALIDGKNETALGFIYAFIHDFIFKYMQIMVGIKLNQEQMKSILFNMNFKTPVALLNEAHVMVSEMRTLALSPTIIKHALTGLNEIHKYNNAILSGTVGPIQVLALDATTKVPSRLVGTVGSIQVLALDATTKVFPRLVSTMHDNHAIIEAICENHTVITG